VAAEDYFVTAPSRPAPELTTNANLAVGDSGRANDDAARLYGMDTLNLPEHAIPISGSMLGRQCMATLAPLMLSACGLRHVVLSSAQKRPLTAIGNFHDGAPVPKAEDHTSRAFSLFRPWGGWRWHLEPPRITHLIMATYTSSVLIPYGSDRPKEVQYVQYGSHTMQSNKD